MTQTKINTIKRGGSRFYVHPDTERGKQPGVTSVLNMLPKGFLKYWAAREAAKCAVDHLGDVVGIALRDPEAAKDFIRRAPDRDLRQASERGDDVHELFEKRARGDKVYRRTLDPELQLYYDHYTAFEELFKPEYLHIEATVWSYSRGYAGSFDWIAWLTDPDTGERTLTMGDNKTTRSGVHEEVAIQLATYAAADCIVLPDGTEVDLPPIEAGAVFHARPDAAKVVPVAIGPEVTAVFDHLIAVMEWEQEGKKRVLGPPIELDTIHPKK